MYPEQDLVGGIAEVEIHGVGLEPAGMGGRGVQRIEVVIGELGFGPGGHLVSETHEDIDHFIDRLLDQVERALRSGDRLERDIDAVAR